MMRDWWKSGDPWVWMTAAAVSVSLIVVLGLLALIAVQGLRHFWPSAVVAIEYRAAQGMTEQLLGEMHDTEQVNEENARNSGFSVAANDTTVQRFLLKTGNRDIYGNDFRWVWQPAIQRRHIPQEVLVIERREWGNLYGYLQSVQVGSTRYDVVDTTDSDDRSTAKQQAWTQLQQALERVLGLAGQIHALEKREIGAINSSLEQLRLRERRLELKGRLDSQARAQLEQEKQASQAQYQVLQQQLRGLYQAVERDSLTLKIADGSSITVPMNKVVRVYQPNAMGLIEKIGFYFSKIGEFIGDEPREANTEGGIFPAIFGTVMMVIIMSLVVTPFGVIAAVYLREYAKQGTLTRIIRIAVNNLAGVPSIVYGVFGLGFFVYFIGGGIDAVFFPEALPAPTYGTPGILWASLTLAILTMPVVIVATEEGLARIPRATREGSLALGATKAETLWRTVLPMATPAMMTGLILAVARAAGEVAPLMLVGVVKLAPSLPLDGNFPYVHLERKFMHLGFHIYDVGFQSPNVEAARPLVYATALLLVLVILVLNLAAIWIRNRLRERYRGLES